MKVSPLGVRRIETGPGGDDPPLPQPPLNGGCWTAIKTSANCYEIYLAGLSPDPPFDDATPAPEPRPAKRRETA